MAHRMLEKRTLHGILFLVLVAALVSSVRCEECARGGMVVTASPPATSVGVEILAAGGNAVDAAAAVGFALAVSHPQAGNLGGGGFMLIRLASGETCFLDYREKAPLAASRDMYLDSLGNVIEGMSLLGAMASGVPGSVAGLHEAHARYGILPWADIVRPAIALAGEGFVVGEKLAASLERLQPHIARFPALRQFTRADGTALQPGDTLRQEELARTLELIAEKGPEGFYRGPVADCIVAEMRSGGGMLSHEDLEQYRVVAREPVRGTYRGYEIISAPPPSSGGTILLEILNIVEGFDIRGMGYLSEGTIHHVVEAERRAYADRARYLGDPDRVDNHVALLIAKEYAHDLRDSILPRATPSRDLGPSPSPGGEKEETTHYSIVDKSGNAVSTTTTLNDSYGSKVVVRGAGFLLNNEMDDFSIKPGVPNLYGLVGSEANAIEPGKRMLSSMAPTIVLEDGALFLVLGTPGGSTIITTITQILIDMIDFGMSLEEAVAAPRYHHQWLPDCITAEYEAFGGDIKRGLAGRGHRIEERRDTIGDAQVIRAGGSAACGMSDPRGGGSADGVERPDSAK